MKNCMPKEPDKVVEMDKNAREFIIFSTAKEERK